MSSFSLIVRKIYTTSFAFVFTLTIVFGQTFVKTDDLLTPAYSGRMQWADLDNDRDLDLIYSGFTTDGFGTFVYQNNAGVFSEIVTGLPDIRNGSFALGDFDQDNDLDVLLSGLDGIENISALYQNNGNLTFTLYASYPGLINTTTSWFDIDNDQDLDFLIAGVDDGGNGTDPFVERTLVYENINGVFALLQGTQLPACTQCSMDWADGNGDGMTDLLVTGLRSDSRGRSEIWLNNGNKTFTRDRKSILRNVANGDAKWGDYDNDGDMDVLLSGVDSNAPTISTTIYENKGGVLVQRTPIGIASAGENWFDGTRWADYDSDGLLDIIISGRSVSILSTERYLKVYKNQGNGSFQELTGLNLEKLTDSSVDLGDYDNDGDLDLCYLGIGTNGLTSGIYKNMIIDKAPSINQIPLPPASDTFSENSPYRKQITLNWGIGSDTETPAPGLSYNIVVRNAAKAIVLPAINTLNGYIRSNNTPNGHAQKIVLDNIPEGTNYWAVQTVDGGKLGSMLSTEKSFYHINGPTTVKGSIVDVANLNLTWLDNSSVESIYKIQRSTIPSADFSDLASLPADATTYTDNGTFETEKFYYYRVWCENENKTSPYDSFSIVIPRAPSMLVAKSVHASRIELSWKDNSKYETGVAIERKLSSEPNSAYVVLVTTKANRIFYQDNGLTEGTSYDYRIRAVNSYGSSELSNVASAQTNFRPSAANIQKEAVEDIETTLAVSDFTAVFSDNDLNDMLEQVIITSLPQKGTLMIGASNVVNGQIIQTTSLDQLRFIPHANQNGQTTFNFYVHDGKDSSAIAYQAILDIAAVNDIPSFALPDTVRLEEDFINAIEITPTLVAVPPDEVMQSVTYSISAVTNNIAVVDFNPSTGLTTLTAVPDAFGLFTIHILANDGQSAHNIFQDSIVVVINPVNDEPDLSTIPDQEIEVTGEIEPISFTIGDAEEPLETLVITATSDNQELIKDENILITGSGVEKMLVIVQEPGVSGEVTITVTVNDGINTTAKQFKIVIQSVLDADEDLSASVKVYPVPTQDKLFVVIPTAFKGDAVITIRDTMGREMYNQSRPSKTFSVNTQHWMKGIYILTIQENGKGKSVLHRKVIKE